ncbi:MAG: DinB family protein [Pleurocapsa minor GSE-CHR-MK-17-07R]|jgi:uncharacterized damage-inducible protein DinB|nr:DinB family protein [Pleurocapsa minor GSE-CHR-MK 17-07R]
MHTERESTLNADPFRRLFEYHFTMNCRVWNVGVMALTDEQYVQPGAYSIGSVRNQCVHMVIVDDAWLQDLKSLPGEPDDADEPPFGDDRAALRARWDAVEAEMRAWLDGLTDEMLLQRMVKDDYMQVWEALFHMLNHGTDHRAQLLALLHALGATTFPQDYCFYAEDLQAGAPDTPEGGNL